MGITVVAPELVQRTESPQINPVTVAQQRECELTSLIRRAVEHETQRGVSNLGVEVRGSEVLLTGWCKSYYVKQKAQHAAMLLHRHGSLVNKIHVY